MDNLDANKVRKRVKDAKDRAEVRHGEGSTEGIESSAIEISEAGFVGESGGPSVIRAFANDKTLELFGSENSAYIDQELDLLFDEAINEKFEKA